MKKLDLLVMMSYLDTVFKDDLLLAFVDSGNHQSRLINGLIKQGYLEESVVDKLGLKGQQKNVVKITTKGRVYISDHFNTNRYAAMTKRTSQPFATTNLKKFTRALGDNRIKLFCNSAGVASLPYEKPSLYYLLYKTIPDFDSNRPEKSTVAFQNDFYNNSINLDSLLERGVYYSISEFIEYFKDANMTLDKDISNVSRFRGILLLKDKTVLVYLPRLYSNRKLKISRMVEERLIKKVRNIFCMFNKVVEIGALTLLNTDSLVSTMTLNGTQGSNEGGAKSKNNIYFLEESCDLFANIYAFPHTLAGLDSFNYFAHNDNESWKKESYRLFDSLEDFYPLHSDIPIPFLFGKYRSAKTYAIFMPYYDIKLLGWINRYYWNIAIITYPDMADTISHSIRKPPLIFDTDGDRIDVQEYMQDGRPVGYTYKEKTKGYRKRKSKISYELPLEEKKMLKTLANQKGMSLSSLVRHFVRKEYDNSIGDHQINEEDNILILENFE